MKILKDIQAVLFDFDGVLCKGRFYKTLLPNYREIHDWIEKNIFGNKELVWKWMKGQINLVGVNLLISEKTRINYILLKKLYEESIHNITLENDVLDFAKSLKLSGKKIGIVTDNMDVFTQFIVPNYRLDEIFDVIINSCVYGILKKEENGKLLDIALNILGVDIKNSLLIDDSEKTIELFRQKGGQGIIYKSFEDLKNLDS